MQTTTHKAHLIFLQKVKDQYETLRDGLAAGSAPDFTEYKHRVGIIQGLKLALDLLEDAHEIANGDERSL
jgi:hypothetical protein